MPFLFVTVSWQKWQEGTLISRWYAFDVENDTANFFFYSTEISSKNSSALAAFFTGATESVFAVWEPLAAAFSTTLNHVEQ
jgi:hypothetical protein